MTTPPTFILAEPDRLFCNALRVAFTELGLIPLIAESAEDAVAFAKHTVSDLVVIDVGALGTAGYEACFRIRRTPGYADQPIVLTATEVSKRESDAAYAAKATTLLRKPYAVSDLELAIKPHLAADSPLLKHYRMRLGAAESEGRVWDRPESYQGRYGEESALTRNGQLLPIVRRAGVCIPRIRSS
jgi:CheY-like chemotaxis protein